MKTINRNYYLIFALFPLFLTLGLVLFFPNIANCLWNFVDEKNIDVFPNKTLFNHVNKEFLFVIGAGYSLILYSYWIFKNKILLFSKKHKIRSFSVFLIGIVVAYWAYSSVAKNLIFILIGILTISGIYQKKKYKLNTAIFIFALFWLLQFISLLWFSGDIEPYKVYLKDPFILFLICISLIVVRFSDRDKNIFISLLFKFFLLFMIWHIITYAFTINSLDGNLLSCFTFDKCYIEYYDVFQFTKYMHPNFISWLLLIIGGVGYTFKNKTEFVNRTELIAYWFLLLWFIYIFQGRLAQLGYFIVLGCITFFELSARLSRKTIVSIIGIGFVLFIGGVYFLFNHTGFFNDPYRLEIYTSAFESIRNNPYFGTGMFSEKILLKQAKINLDHYHNDFYQALIRQGFFGLIFLILSIISLFFYSLKRKNLSFFFFLVPTFLIMLIDSPFIYAEIVSISSVFIFIFGEKSLEKKNIDIKEFSLLTNNFQNQTNPKVTIFTPTYNRAYSLPKLYESLLSQDNNSFEWLIVDDGSSDNTTELVQNWINENKINICYIKKHNGGKHTAINCGVQKARGELFFIVDSDDYLAKNALEFIINEYDKIKDNNEFCGLSGLKIYPNGEKVGGGENFGVLDCSSLDFRYKHKVQGDMAEVFKTSVLKEFPFPEIEGEKFCQEALVFNRIAQKYKIRWIYEKIYICEYLPDGLTYSFDKIQIKSPKLAKIYYKELSQYNIPESEKIKAIKQYYRFAFNDSLLGLDFPFKNQGIIKSIRCFISGFVKYLRDCKKYKI